MNYTDEGISFLCDPDGTIKIIYYNKISAELNKTEGQLFTNLFIQSHISKAIEFLLEIKKNSASYGWELIFKMDDKFSPYFFSGTLVEENIIIFGFRNRVDFEHFLTGIMQINNEQTDRIRTFEKNQQAKLPEDGSKFNFDEFTRLNNELISTQRKLAKQNQELTELNNLKNQFLGMAAHDLRNPLGTILNYSEFLEEEAETLSQEQLEFIAQIKYQSRFILNLITELLDVSAIESGKINLKSEPVNIVSLVEKNIQLNRNFAEKKQIKINFNKRVKSMNILLDKGKIEQVITNLITNAIKFSQPNTQINVDIVCQTDYTIVSVKDEGQGIAEEELKLLFKPFQKTSTESTGGEKSTGLGLFIVKKIVKAHKGKIWVESKLNFGSTFYVSLPN